MTQNPFGVAIIPTELAVPVENFPVFHYDTGGRFSELIPSSMVFLYFPSDKSDCLSHFGIFGQISAQAPSSYNYRIRSMKW